MWQFRQISPGSSSQIRACGASSSATSWNVARYTAYSLLIASLVETVINRYRYLGKSRK
ncbi:hypothetical protein D1BOALGB6SA_7846 [Olavius sp. associated proteobacterium Delta 1]|nr:hypothetical protein D1BOALGB6SA_7846 [Olavius sp. associated proteobacterium Delta 1]